jgi:hypothetical protein
MRQLPSLKTFTFVYTEQTPQTRQRDLVEPSVAWTLELPSEATRLDTKWE